jgi:hypothetical protein
MRQISDAIKALLKHNEISGLRHKLLLYRRKWDSAVSAYIVETSPVDITEDINHTGTNVVINQQLDTDIANIWKVGNLSLTLYNENNRFWQDKEDGLFPQPYIIYGSKIEYYIGIPALNDYVKCFTGYLTEMPHYRQDEGLVEIRVLDRLERLKTISAENVSTKVVAEQLKQQDSARCITANAGVGRVQRVLRGTSFDTAVVLREKTDYTISQLNNYNNGAIIELKSALTAGENSWADYIYWHKGITIDDLVNRLLSAGGVESAHRIIEPVVFHNTARVAEKISAQRLWCWIYYADVHGSSKLPDNSSFNPANVLSGKGLISCKMPSGSIKFTISENHQKFNRPLTNREEFFHVQMKDFINVGITMYFAPFHSGNPTPCFEIGWKWKPPSPHGKGFHNLGTYSLNDTFIISFDNSHGDFRINLRKNGQQIWNNVWKNAPVSDIESFEAWSGANSAKIRDLQASPETAPTVWHNCPFYLMNIQKTESEFLGFEKLDATISATGTPDGHIFVSCGNNMSNWTPFVEYKFGNPMPLNYNSLQVLIKNTAEFGNNYNLSNVRLWSFLRQNIPLGVCNLTNMSMFEALKELATLSMYEMGFDANDKFFFRKRHQTTALKTITDDENISMDGVQYDVSRLKTRVIVGYGEYTKVVDSDTQQESHPTNKDKYGERVYEISGSQLLPADNVDLAYAVAPTIYSELSKLRLTLSIKTVLDLELELGDYVRIVHKNNLFVGNGFADFTNDGKPSADAEPPAYGAGRDGAVDGKPKGEGSSSVFYMKCKVVGIRTDFNKRTTLLDLIDYTQAEESMELDKK